MFYFSYGSNMDPRQILRRCPSSKFYSRAILQDYKLDFTLKSRRRRCGVANVIPCETKKVVGVIYQIKSTRDWERLDSAEGFKEGRDAGNLYTRSLISTDAYDKKKPNLLAYIYIGLIENSPPPPSNLYLDQIIYGAQYWGLPSEYIQDIINMQKIRYKNHVKA